ncbi:MAG: BatD family protein [Prevotellaceae bacterium]|nr:BatD family protein [Prevotellaceae bacterium]
MSRRAFSLIVASALALASFAQVTVDVSLDSLQLLVGEQTGITLEVSCDTKQSVEFPAFQPGQELVPDVEIVKVLPLDTTFLNERARMQLTQKYIVTAWDSSFYYLPPLEVRVDGKAYQSKSLALKVYTIDVDTTNVDMFFGPKSEMDAPFSWEDWRWVVGLSILAVLLLIVAAVVWVSLKTGTPIIRIIRRKPKLPAHKVALEEIARIKSERTWAQEDSKEYYTRLTDTLRTYIQERYKFSAMEMTSGEIIERLTEENDEEALAELRELFRTADLVKFAKYSTLINENDANLMTALEYINQTKVEVDPKEEQEVEVETPEEKHRRLTLVVKWSVVSVCALLFVAALCWIVYRVIDLVS